MMPMEGLVEPEIVSGMGVDWKDYTPPGGYAFQKFFRETYSVTLNKVRKDIEKRRDALNSAGVEIAEFRKNVAAFKKLISSADLEVVKTMLGEELANRLNGEKELAERLEECVKIGTHDDGERQAIETDIALVKAVDDYFKADLELDMVLFANGLVPIKFRTKVFRHVMKVLFRVEDDMRVIDNTKSPMKDGVMEAVKVAYEDTHKCYAELSKGLRKQRKAVDRLGMAFWEQESWAMGNSRKEYDLREWEGNMSGVGARSVA